MTTAPRSNPSERDDVQSPSLSSTNALARFEFEPGRSKDGTKVLMVEWEDDETTKDIASEWEISWEGKRTVLPARNPTTSSHHGQTSGEKAVKANGDGNDEPFAASNTESPSPVNRLYFLLGPGVSVPVAVRLQKGTVVWHTNPLPAIFAPELGMTARSAGKKGVLHTVWAKKRLQALQGEIDRESQFNAEGVGLQMAVAEKEWIEQNFGVLARPTNISLTSVTQQQQQLQPPGSLNSPTSPRSPGGGRLMDKLKGLKLDTGEAPGRKDVEHNPLSPETSDVAVSGFSSFAELKGLPPVNTVGAKSPQPPQQQPAKRIAAQRPPDSLLAAQQQRQASLVGQAGAGGMGSLNAAFAIADNTQTFSPSVPTKAADDDDDDDDDEGSDLFALPMSPRSPEMAKSPFSFAGRDVKTTVGGGKQAS